ncbi:uncharacterized protein [Lepeophtheirus salmonis]|uniref:uncharacterized protein n=1 Tax=Lepeophtheirus salmonis TaxID=72036 RepID=UPI001AE841F4|nr:uncharacterized protein LOC121127737 [Lepeophtheirus salmonis]
MDNRKVKLQEIAENLMLSKVSVYTIIHEHLGMKKLFSKWVLCLLTLEQKRQQEYYSMSCWDMFMWNKKEFLPRYITMDETWIHHIIPESSECCTDGESRPKTQTSAGKVMASIWPQRLLSLRRTQKDALWKEIGPDEEVIVETEAYLEGLDKSLYSRGI